MKDDWLHKIHERMADYETDEPANLWAAIENAHSRRLTKSGYIYLWIKRGVAVAAMLAVAICLFVFLIKSPGDMSEMTVTPTISEAEPTLPKNVDVLLADLSMPSEVVIYDKDAKYERGSTNVSASGHVECEDTTVAGSVDVAASSGREDAMTSRQKSIAIPTGQSTVHQRLASPSHNKFAFSVYGSGGTGNVQSRRSADMAHVSGIGPEYSSWEDNPMLGILTFNKGKVVSTDIRHRLPIRVGITLSYNINRRFGLESGICYTNLTSDIREGSDSHYMAGEQVLHYIGIPLNLKYHILSWQRLDLYASAGALVEKCVSAKLDSDIILDSQRKSSVTQSISERPVQWSANVSVGLQYRIAGPLNIFVEPGVSYYFDDASTLRTIYKDKPLNFNFNMGVRFDLNR